MRNVFQDWRQTMNCVLLISSLIPGCSGDSDNPEISSTAPLEAPVVDALPITTIEAVLRSVASNPKLTADDIRQIATDHLQAGMAVSEANDLLAKCGLTQTMGAASGGGMTEIYGTRDIYGPSLSVYSSDVNLDGNGRLTAWVRTWQVHEARPRPTEIIESSQEIPVREVRDDSRNNY